MIDKVKEAVPISAGSRCVPFLSPEEGANADVTFVVSSAVAVVSEEEQLYVFNEYSFYENSSTGTDQDEQHQELHCGGGEGVKTLVDVGSCLHDCIEFIPPSLQFHCYASFKTTCYGQD